MHKRWMIVVGSSWYIMCEFGGWCGGRAAKKAPGRGLLGMTMGYLRGSAAAPSKAMSAAAVAVLTKSFAPVVGLPVVVLGVSSVGT